MWPNPQFPADLVIFIEEILNGKFHILCSDLETTSSTFLSKCSSEIFLSQIINYWGSIFTLYIITLKMFSLVCVLSRVFFLSFFLSFFLFFYFFFFYRFFIWQILTIHRIAGKEEGIIVFLFSISTHPRTFI